MKKIITLLAIVLFSFSSFAQDLTNQLYFRFGFSSPSWTQYGMEEDDWGSGVSKAGATFELGSIFMLKGILNSENVSFGINADYLYLTFGEFSIMESDYDINLRSMRIGSKVGPSFTWSPMDKMAIDIYAKVDIAWASGTSIGEYDYDDDDDEDLFLGYGTVGFSTGLNFRYGLLILGVEFNSISPKLESNDYPGTYFQNAWDGIVGKSSTGDKSDLPCINFTIGLSF